MFVTIPMVFALENGKHEFSSAMQTASRTARKYRYVYMYNAIVRRDADVVVSSSVVHDWTRDLTNRERSIQRVVFRYSTR